MTAAGWMHRNLDVQGYRLSTVDAARLRVGLRFSTAVCLACVILGLALESAALLFGLAAIGVVAGFASRHPFDLVWNHGVRHLTEAPELPPNPVRRRHAFKVAAVWLALVGALLAAGVDTLALGLGLALVGGCALVTATNFCIPSTVLALLERPQEIPR